MTSSDDDEWRAFLHQLADDLTHARLPDGTIPDFMYTKTVDTYFNALDKGLGGITFGFDDARNSLKAYLQDNLAQFSAAKSLTELKFFNQLLTKENGELRTFNEFRDAVMRYGILFNKNYLKTEYNTAVAAAQNARKYDEFLKQGVEYLEYRTMEDDRVRPAHAVLDGFTAGIENDIWNTIMPPLDFNCRCTVIPGVQANAGKLLRTLNKSTRQLVRDAEIPPAFQNNPAVSKLVFKPTLPYYVKSGISKDGGKTIKILQARKNYGLRPLFSDVHDTGIYNAYSFDAPVMIESKEAAENWWKDNAVDGAMTFTDNKGLTLRTNNGFLNHILHDNNQYRELIVANLGDVVKHPDEVWSKPDMKDKSDLVRTYIKYYKERPIVVQVNGKGEIYTIYEPVKENASGKLMLNDKAIINLRQGNLIYNKIR